MAALTAHRSGSEQPVLLLGPGCPADWPWPGWAELVAPSMLLGMAGFDADRMDAAMSAARRGDRALLTVRVGQFETVIGPEWRPGGSAGCAGCAELFQRASSPTPIGDPAAIDPGHAGLVEAVLHGGVGPGQVVTISAAGQIRRHALGRSAGCPHCADPAADRYPATSPGRLITFRPRPAAPDNPTRQGNSASQLAQAVRELSGGRRFGNLQRHRRHSRAPFPVAEVGLGSPGRAGHRPVGYGRGASLRTADDLAVLEAAERLGGHPSAGRLIRGISRRELGTAALPLGAFGGYTQEQLRSPLCRIRECTDDTEMDWAWAQSLTGDRPRLLPADLAFPWHRYPDPDEPARQPGRLPGARRGPSSAGHAESRRSRNWHFLESSSGTALGASREEALLHALFECVERDAFQLAWHRQQPLVRIDPASITDPESRLLMHVIDRQGFDVHLLVATSDVPLPVVWALAVNRSAGTPASFSNASANPNPAHAVRSALWELAGQPFSDVHWDPAQVRPLVADPWLVSEFEDHWRRYTDPELLPRVLRCVGPDRVPLAEAFGEWPAAFAAAAGGDLLAGVRFLASLLAEAGMPEVFVVDQTTPTHAAAGLAVVRALVPGLVPLTFGQANQRYRGLPRLLAGLDPATIPFDPHPFP